MAPNNLTPEQLVERARIRKEWMRFRWLSSNPEDGDELDSAESRRLDDMVADFVIESRGATSTARDALREALSWTLDILDMYDTRLAAIDGDGRVYTRVHVAAKAKARAVLAAAPGGRAQGGGVAEGHGRTE